MSRFNTVLITGANRGIGLRFVEHYAGAAQRVIACCRSPETAQALQNLQKSNSAIEVHQLDVRDAQHLEKLQSQLNGQTIDLLINNAGLYGPKVSDSLLDKRLWTEVFEVNVMAPIEIARQLRPQLKNSQNAVVANISSKMGSIEDNSSGGATIYRSSKAALNAATKSFALDNVDLGITTIMLHPGWVQTDMGGPNALINVTTSVKGMSEVFETVGRQDNGQFFNYDGSSLPW